MASSSTPAHRARKLFDVSEAAAKYAGSQGADLVAIEAAVRWIKMCRDTWDMSGGELARQQLRWAATTQGLVVASVVRSLFARVAQDKASQLAELDAAIEECQREHPQQAPQSE